MIVSSIILLFFIILNLLYQLNRSFFSKSSVKFLLLMVGFILLQILRIYCQQYFGDISEYKELFTDAKSFTEVVKERSGVSYFVAETALEVESGYRVFMSLFKSFSDDYSLFLFLISVIELATFYYFCQKMRINIWGALPIYISLTYITFQIGMLRQALAFCVFLLAIMNLHRKWVYLSLITIGFFFHRSMAFCVLLIWADKFIHPKYFTYIFVVSLVIYILKIELVKDLYEHFVGDYSNRVNFYFTVERENNYLGIGFWERVISFVIMTCFYNKLIIKRSREVCTVYSQSNRNACEFINNFLTKKANSRIDKKTLYCSNFNGMTIWYNLGASVILLQMYFFSSPTITSRLRYYIVIFPMIFMVEYMRCNINSYQKRISYMLPVYVYLFLYLYAQAGYLMGIE